MTDPIGHGIDAALAFFVLVGAFIRPLSAGLSANSPGIVLDR
ncbi:hypothetical protein [Streptomyces canus]|nr:hypothetical protein [Streptomyces canus]